MTGAVRAQLEAKLPPVFFEVAELKKKFEHRLQRLRQECEEGLKRLGDKPTDQQRIDYVRGIDVRSIQLVTWAEQALAEIDHRHRNVRFNPDPHKYLYSPTGERGDANETFFRWLHWERHGESLDVTRNRDSSGDLRAWDAIHRTGADLRRLLTRKEPIKPFQGDPVHRELHQLILTYEIEPLTDEERAACFDEYCACGKTHSADALKKQYSRLKKDLAK